MFADAEDTQKVGRFSSEIHFSGVSDD